MRVRIDEAGRHDHPRRIELERASGAMQCAERHHLSFVHRDIGPAARGARVHGPLQQQSLALHTGVDPSPLVSTQDVLERGGLAVRDKKPGDRRAHLVSLTDRGERRVPRLFQLWDAVEEDLTRDLTAGDRKALLGMIQGRIGILYAGSPPCG